MSIIRLLVIEDELVDAGLRANEIMLALSTGRSPNGCCPTNPTATADALRETTATVRSLTLEKFGILAGLVDTELAKTHASRLCGKQVALLDMAMAQYEAVLAQGRI